MSVWVWVVVSVAVGGLAVLGAWVVTRARPNREVTRAQSKRWPRGVTRVGSVPCPACQRPRGVYREPLGTTTFMGPCPADPEH